MISNTRGDIVKVVCTDLKLDGTIVISNIETYEHEITYSTTINFSPETTKVYLVQSTTGFKYQQSISKIVGTKIYFKTEPNNHELALFDQIELSLLSPQETLNIRQTVKRIEIQHVSSLVKYECGKVKLPVSNMLYPRIKLGFPKWGTIERNDISTGSKLLEPLFTPFYDSFHKVIKYNMKSKFKEGYSNVKSIFLGDNPEAIVRTNEDESLTRLYEASSIETQPRRINLKTNTDKLTLSRFVLEENDEAYIDYTPFENKLIYIKKVSGFEEENASVYIKGLDQHGERLEERVYILENFYTVSRKRFARIFSIQSQYNCIVSNYVDCRFDHYLVKDIKTIAPIVDGDLFAFHPKVLKSTNIENNRPIVNLHNISKELSEVAYKFDIENISGKITSLYIDEHLRTIWTDGIKIYSSVIHHDLSKDIGNHPSNNNNEIVKVLDKNTSINDWVDAVIDTAVWPDKTPMIIQIKNDSSIKYYDQESETFVDNIVYFYPQKNERYIEISVKVENDSPYIFSVLSDDFNKRYVASSHSNMLHSIDTKGCTGTLLLTDGQVKLVSNFETAYTTMGSQESTKVKIVIEPLGVNSYNWQFNTLGQYFGTNGSTYREDLYRIISKFGENNLPVVFEVDRFNILREFSDGISTNTLEVSVNPLYNENETSKFNIYLIDNSGVTVKTIEFATNDSTITLEILFTEKDKEINYAN